MWINPILQDMLRHIFQSCILESNEEILELIQKVGGMTHSLSSSLERRSNPHTSSSFSLNVLFCSILFFPLLDLVLFVDMCRCGWSSCLRPRSST